jgi:group II intron reverse transcriptase/maturase
MSVDEVEVLEGGAHSERIGRNPGMASGGAETDTAYGAQPKSERDWLMSQVVERANMQLAYNRVMKNRGAPGVDGMRCEDLKAWLKANWAAMKQQLLEGSYRPQAVRRVDIPKPQGGVRTLGVPTVFDRLIQHALHQGTQPLFEPTFSENSYGFRPGRSAQQAVRKAAEFIQGGKRWVVDMDLEKFFDRVNHDVLMARVARVVKDPMVLRLIRRYLEAGMMANGVETPRYEGTPQGGPLSPLLSNILLSDLDRELEKRHLSFCRYADDANIYVSSERSGLRVMDSVRGFLANRLKLTVNEAKSAVARPWQRKFLGYSVTAKGSKIRIAKPSIERLKESVRKLCIQGRGRTLSRTIDELNPVLRGWMNYFSLSQSRRPIEDLDTWVRRRLRCLVWRQWKRPRTRESKLRSLGLDAQRAWKSSVNGRGPWWNAGARHMIAAMPPRLFKQLGLVSLVATHQHLQRST